MRPSRDPNREAIQAEMDRKMEAYLANGGTVTVMGADAYRREGFKLTRSQLTNHIENRKHR